MFSFFKNVKILKISCLFFNVNNKSQLVDIQLTLN